MAPDLKALPSFCARLPQPQWTGQSLGDSTLLLRSEQGFGDTIQFIRYLPLVAQRTSKIVLWCPSGLRRLLQSLTPPVPVLTEKDPLPSFDAHCPLLHLPRLFATTVETIPHNVPYLTADPQAAQAWQSRLTADEPALKVGLVWAGNPANINDRNRSLTLSTFAPLAKVKGVRFFSLQKRPPGRRCPCRPEWISSTLRAANRFCRHRRRYRQSRSGDRRGHGRRPPRRRHGKARLDARSVCSRLALAAPPPGYPLVSHDAPLPPAHSRRLVHRHRPSRRRPGRTRRPPARRPLTTPNVPDALTRRLLHNPIGISATVAVRRPIASNAPPRNRSTNAPDSSEQAQWLPSRLIPHRHRPRAELQPAHEPQVDMLR